MTKRSVTKKPKLTQWFHPSVKPVRVGFYETGFGNEEAVKDADASPFLWWWNGSYWLASDTFEIVRYQERYWRGLAQNPEVQP